MVVKFEQYIWQDLILSDLVKAFKAVDVIFIHIFVERGAEGDVTPDAGNPFINTTFDLKATLAC